jgi:vesicle-associated membrane protein 72
MPLVYALVARASDAAPLASHAAVQGNFEAVATECLQRARAGGAGGDERFTVAADGYSFHFLVAGGYAFVVAADEAYGQAIPFAW